MTSNNDSSSPSLVRYFLFTFLFSWLLWLPGVLITYDLIHINQAQTKIYQIINWVAGVGPSLAAIYLIFKFEGKSSVKKLFSRVLQIKLGYWYIPVFLFLPAVLVLAHLLNIILFDASFPVTGLLAEPWWIPVLFIIFFIMQFSEELGWRGYALDGLQKKWNALVSSLILGCIWAIWHIPMFLISGFGQHDNQLPYSQFFITIVLMSVIITWLQNNTNASLVPAFIVHALINLSGEVLPLIEKNNDGPSDFTVWIITNILLFLTASTIVIKYGYKKLVRQKGHLHKS